MSTEEQNIVIAILVALVVALAFMLHASAKRGGELRSELLDAGKTIVSLGRRVYDGEKERDKLRAERWGQGVDLSKCTDCGGFRGHGHECPKPPLAETPEPSNAAES